MVTKRRLFSRSKRQNLIYIMMLVWIVMAIAGFATDANFTALATYFGTFAAPAMTYIWAETKRKHEG